MGVWRSTEVAIKKLRNQNLNSTALKDFSTEIELMWYVFHVHCVHSHLLTSDLRHPNITLFMGACLKSPDLCIVTEYMARGDLYTILHNLDLKLPWTCVLGTLSRFVYEAQLV